MEKFKNSKYFIPLFILFIIVISFFTTIIQNKIIESSSAKKTSNNMERTDFSIEKIRDITFKNREKLGSDLAISIGEEIIKKAKQGSFYIQLKPWNYKNRDQFDEAMAKFEKLGFKVEVRDDYPYFGEVKISWEKTIEEINKLEQEEIK